MPDSSQMSSDDADSRLAQATFVSAPTPDSNSRVVRAVLITIAIFVGVGIIAVAGIGLSTWYFRKSFHEVPSATFTANDLGVALYPGSEPSLSGSRGEWAGETIVGAVYYTRDSADQVVTFYKDRLGPGVRVTTSMHGTKLQTDTSKGNTTTVNILRITDAAGAKTSIHILHYAPTASSH